MREHGQRASGGNASSLVEAPVTARACRDVAAFARKEKLFRRTQKILVAVSGGPDSVACLLLLLRLRQQFGFEVVVAHFDHRLREGSAADLEFVRSLSAQLEVKCLTGEGDAGALAAERGMGIEEAARRMRYQFLAFVAGKEGADCIATGHTADDQAETVLQRVLRGTGVRGLRGMLPASEVPGAPSQRLVRPLLVVRRADTGLVCAEAGIQPRNDPTNLDLSIGRNRVRHEALGVLRAINPSIDRALVGLAESAREIFAPVARAALATQPLERGPDGSIFTLEAMAALPTEAVTLVIEREAAFHGLVAEVNRTRMRNLVSVFARGTGEVMFGPIVVEASTGLLRIGPAADESSPAGPVVLNVPGVTLADGWRIEALTSEPASRPGASMATVDLGALKGTLRVRPLLPGDRVPHHGALRNAFDVLLAERVPRWKRQQVLAVSDSTGILALLGGPPALCGSAPPDTALYIVATRTAPLQPAQVTRSQ
ncbi:MAG: tRNA lysidine(34) synthetase TilS [Dehalococcoidia bacterium]|nr:tRNA lysidine(34) synthetase TilS [Dehalococcoidia bacterium]